MCEVVYCPRCGAEMSAVFGENCPYCAELDRVWDKVASDLTDGREATGRVGKPEEVQHGLMGLEDDGNG